MSLSANPHLHPFVERLTTHSALSADEKDAVLALPAHQVTLRAKQDFAHANEDGQYVSMIETGLVACFSQTGDGHRQITALHIPGDMADLGNAVIDVRCGSLSALTQSTIIKVPRDALVALATARPRLAMAFWRDGAADAAVLTQWTINVGRRDAQARLAHILCEMAIRYGQHQMDCPTYAFPLTQEHLGDATALTAIHVNRSLRALRDEGLVTFRQGVVTIQDWAGLARLAEFNPVYLPVARQRPGEMQRAA